MVSTVNSYHKPNAEAHKTALAAIERGDWVIACMGKGNWTTSGHYVLWYGMDGNNVLINDSWSTKKAQTNAAYSLFRNEVKFYWIVKVPDKFKEDDEVVQNDVVVVNDKEYTVSMIRKDGTTYIKTRDIATILNLEIGNKGRIPVLTQKK